jgi:hypothetical protein
MKKIYFQWMGWMYHGKMKEKKSGVVVAKYIEK